MGFLVLGEASVGEVRTGLNCAEHPRQFFEFLRLVPCPLRSERVVGKRAVNGIGLSFCGEFDSGSERTLAAWIRHASRADSTTWQQVVELAANGRVTRGNLPLSGG